MTAPDLRGPDGRRWGLRSRLIALVLIVAALALAAVDIVLPMNLRASLVEGRANTLQSVLNTLPRPQQGQQIDADLLADLSNSSSVRGELGWTVISPTGISKSIYPAAADRQANPAFEMPPPTTEAEIVSDASRPGVTYLALAVNASVDQQSGGYLVAWSPLTDVNAAVNRLVLVELLITVGLLLLLGGTASLIVRRQLKPLEDMAGAADAIAGGELDRRVTVDDASTEVGRLGAAFNDMLDGIGGLLAERTRNEERLRQFIADASHELRTPVAAVRGYTDLYAAGALTDEESVTKAMTRMGFEARRMGALVEDLLTLIQADAERATRYERVDLAELLLGVVDDAAVIDATRTWRLAGTPSGAPWNSVVLGDRLRLHQLFANLLANVRTHTPAGTVATISVLANTEDVAVTVSDNGPGVSDEALDRLFDRFFRVDPSRSRENGGTGLGLSIVAAIVRAHGGTIRASHTPGGGLSMTVLLRRASGTAAVDPGSAQLVEMPDAAPPVRRPGLRARVGARLGAATAGRGTDQRGEARTEPWTEPQWVVGGGAEPGAPGDHPTGRTGDR
ncbi:sensor histidine kinase [Nakamurella leprariae]|uniref:histidine kinase n=1 Tax=Nakamurella leprariae TaxID=2803911 RepID=A0A939C0B4_9ACTN|nr:HAMP domain-containing sensor histidine kinase [Nakamurella leprariae]MBM9468581.1 HAMP domain-containing histidine kinase [Nakamurella leprariae]